MKQHQGIWLPDHEEHLLEWMTKSGEIVEGRGTYQIKKLRAALKHCKTFDHALDIGAHVGMWAMQLQKRFSVVSAFEPVAEHRACFEKNVPPTNVVLYPYALGSGTGLVKMETETGSSGNTCARIAGDGDVVMRTLDSFYFMVDFVKIDCEGFEEKVVLGGRETFLRCKPCVIVEQKPHVLQKNYGINGAPAVEALKSLGAQVRQVISGDYILSW